MWKILLTFFCLSVINAQTRNYSNFPCPSKCVCFRRAVRCMKLDLVAVPKPPSQTTLLDARFNKIVDITPGHFKGNHYVRSLLLNNNLLTELHNGVFTGLHQLRHLYLYKNRIRHIQAEAFQGLFKLEQLYLYGNLLKTFGDGTFSNLPSLNRIFLHNNKIEHISPQVFQNLPKLRRLRLDQNALICDCKMAWLSKMLNQNSLQVAARCKYPSEMYGKDLKKMSSHDFHCKPPEIMEGPEDVEITLGAMAIFTCKVEGDPEPSITWIKDHEELNPDNEKLVIMRNGSLMIKDLNRNDAGQYECMAKNNDGETKSRPARMTINDVNQPYGVPTFAVTPTSVTTSDGVSSIQLFCRADGNPQPTISWSFNGIQIQSSPRYSIGPDGTLTIGPVQDNDHGSYTCYASNAYGRIKAQANVLITEPPTFSLHPENQDVQIGNIIKLECVAVGSPNPQIIWYKDDYEIITTDRILISPDRTLLEIKNAVESDSGLYICEAENPLGTREVSARIKIVTSKQKPPKLVFKPQNVEAFAGTSVEMPCKAEGDPAPGIQWQKDGATLLVTGRTKLSLTGNLYIFDVIPDDRGQYECSAVNEHGRDSAAGYLNVINDNTAIGPGAQGFGDKFIKIAFNDATKDIDRAINNTINSLFHNKGPHTSAELFRLFRYPDAPTRELARAAEVYERTLENIKKHVESGMAMNTTINYSYKEILSKDHLELIASLSGCMAHRRSQNCSDMCFHSKYRSIDGRCNNLENPTLGASSTGFRRLLKPIYEDGFTKPVGWDKTRKYYGFHKPLARLISTTLIATDTITPDEEITHMTMQWGQFLDHDLDHSTPSVSSESWDGIDCKKSCEYAAPCFPMDIPPGDPRVSNRRCIDFIRSSAVCGSGMTSVFFDEIQPREQINQLTAYIDASQVYGYSEELAKDLRDLNGDGGRLREGVQFPERKPLLPYAENQGMDCRRNLSESEVNCFAAGDIRANEQAGLITMHTVWMREHNRLARELKELNPQWDSDTLYHEARKIVGAAMQHITYKHWLPFIIGEKGMEILGKFSEYNPNVNPEVSNVFATAALRFGHTLINPVLHRLDWDFKPIREGHLPLRFAFFSPWRIVDEGGIDPLLRGLFTIPAKLKRPRENLNTELTEQLFRVAHAVALDLAAMNIQRGRDHALPSYIEYRKFCNMPPVDNFDDLRYHISDPIVREKLEELYGHPGNIDVWVGGVLEDPVEGGRVGPLFRCLLIDQFRHSRDGDRFFYENPSVFKPEQLVQIKQYTLSRVLCDNGDNITKITKNAFLLPEVQGGLVECSSLPRISLKHWTECCNDCRFSSQLNTISRLNGGRRRRQIDDLNEFNGNDTIKNYKIENNELREKIINLENDIQDLKVTLKNINKHVKKLENKYTPMN